MDEEKKKSVLKGMYTQDNPGNFHRKLTVDLAVAGGGMAGTAAAIAAARLGLKTVLIQNRPVLGGPAGSECDPEANGRLIGGCGDWRNRDARETGVIEDIRLEGEWKHSHGYRCYYSDMLEELCGQEKNLTLLLNTEIYAVEKSGSSIVKLTARTLGSDLVWEIFPLAVADCTGDASVGFLAGAEFRMGRESRSEFNETLAPEKADHCTLGTSLYFRATDVGHPVKFTPPKWAYSFPDESCFTGRPHQPPRQKCGYYWIEAGGDCNTIADNEAIRRELLKILYGVWDHIKNHGDHQAENLALDWIAAVPGKRESRRLIGDYILTENDETANRTFEDGIVCGGFNIDVHPVGGFFHSGTPCGPEHGIMSPGLYQIPLRCFYSRNIDNLLMAGRDISVSHIALASARVMATCASGGQAAAALAAMMKRYDCKARQAAREHFEELRYRLYRIDHCLPGVIVDDPENLCRDGRAAASSTRQLEISGISGWTRLDGEIPAAQSFVASEELLDWAFFIFRNPGQACRLTAELVESESMYCFDRGKVIARTETEIPHGEDVQIGFSFRARMTRGKRYFIRFGKMPDLEIAYSSVYLPGICRSNMERQGWPPHGDNTNLCCRFEPAQHPFDAENVLNTANRGGDFLSVWISDPACPLPQQLEIRFTERRRCNAVELVFDTNLDSFNIFEPQKECVKSYRLEGLLDGHAELLASENENLRRFRRHVFPEQELDGLRLMVLETWGVPEARVYQIRAYDESESPVCAGKKPTP